MGILQYVLTHYQIAKLQIKNVLLSYSCLFFTTQLKFPPLKTYQLWLQLVKIPEEDLLNTDKCKHLGIKPKSNFFVLQEVTLVRLPLPLLPTPPLDMFSPQWVHSQEARSQQTWLASSPQPVMLKFSHHILTSGFRMLLRGSLAGQQCSFLLTGKAAVNSCMFMLITLDIRCMQHMFEPWLKSLYWGRRFTLTVHLFT